ncbi:group II truncated hemoglobin [Amphritea sp. HPY]|uniref:group II truncated hemoglobin n=1 Tax=Amphritea sp. HPY TaxID=3421652 RepID=UPI003D7E6CA6
MSNPYNLLGGEAGVRNLANEFYNVMATRPDAKKIRLMHAENLNSVQNKLFMFLSGWLGGPNLYFEEHGTICLSSPHAKYSIGTKERDQWLECMDQALDNINASDELKEMLKIPMFNIAETIRNQK